MTQYRAWVCFAATASIVALVSLHPNPARAIPLGTAFTYQGQLKIAGQPATGLHDVQLCLYDSLAGPTSLACAPDFDDVPVEQGVFTITPDFGAAVFSGEQRWLEVRVRAGDSSGAYTTLAPRQLVHPIPEALHANAALLAESANTAASATTAISATTAGSASTAPWSGLSGVPLGFADGIDNNSGGTVISITTGTGLSGGPITVSGSIAIATNGVDASMLADNAVDTAAIVDANVTSAKIADGAVGSSQINTAQVQARISTTCAVGDYFRGVAANGSAVCEPLPGRHVQTLVDDVSGDVVGRYSSISIGSEGNPFVAYAAEGVDDGVKAAFCSNSACTASSSGEAFGTALEPSWISTAIGTVPYISYYDASTDSLQLLVCSASSCNSAPIQLASEGGRYSSMTVPSDMRPIVSFFSTGAGEHLMLARCANPSCTSALAGLVDPLDTQVGEWTSIAIGENGFPAISYHDIAAGSLKFVQCGAPTCNFNDEIFTIDDPANQVGTHTSLAIGSDGLPVISYYDSTANALKVAKCIVANCSAATITTVDDGANDVGQYSSIAVGSDNIPLISYFDATVGVLKFARCNDSACTSAEILVLDDQTGSVGEHSSMAIGADGLPVISYFDAANGALKVLRCGTRSCQ